MCVYSFQRKHQSQFRIYHRNLGKNVLQSNHMNKVQEIGSRRNKLLCHSHFGYFSSSWLWLHWWWFWWMNYIPDPKICNFEYIHTYFPCSWLDILILISSKSCWHFSTDMNAFFCLINLRLDIPTFKLIPDFADLNLIGLGRYLNLVLMSDHRQCILGSWLSFVCFYLCMSA